MAAAIGQANSSLIYIRQASVRREPDGSRRVHELLSSLIQFEWTLSLI